jgi:hypothetical protein
VRIHGRSPTAGTIQQDALSPRIRPSTEERAKKTRTQKKKEERRKRLEICLEEEPAKPTREKMTAISANGKTPLETKPEKNKPIHNHKRGYYPAINKERGSGTMPVCYRHLESRDSEVDDQSIRPNAIAHPKRNNSLR